MFVSFFRTLGALKNAFFWKTFFMVAVISGTIFAVFITGTTIWFDAFSHVIAESWILQSMITIGAAGGAAVMSYFLFPLTFPLVASFFQDGIIQQVEGRYYNEHRAPKAPSLGKILPGAVRFFFVALFLNLIAFPFYVVPVLNMFVYYLLNGYLFGREFYEMVALCHTTQNKVDDIRYKNRMAILQSGILITMLFTIPFINLVAPILATIFMVHMYHRNFRDSVTTIDMTKGFEPE